MYIVSVPGKTDRWEAAARTGVSAKVVISGGVATTAPRTADHRIRRRYGVTVKFRRIAAVSSGSPSAFTRSATACGVTRPQARRT